MTYLFDGLTYRETYLLGSNATVVHIVSDINFTGSVLSAPGTLNSANRCNDNSHIIL